MAKKDEGLNAKNVAFDQPGAGLVLGGVNASNLYAKYDKLRAVKDQKEGGSKQLWDNLSRFTTTANAKNLDPAQAKLYNQYIKTGKVPTGLKDTTVSAAMDWGLREAGRFQQHKPVSLLSQIAGPLLTIAAGAINPALGAAVGGYMGSRNGGGPLSIISGIAGGYLGGNAIANAGGVSGIYDSVKNGVSNFLSPGGFSNPSALGLSGENLGLNFASGAIPAAPVAGYGIGGATAGGLGLTGANLGVGLTNSLGGTPIAGYGNSAVGGSLDTPGLINAPTAGSTPQSVGSKPLPSKIDEGIKIANKGLKIAESLTPAPEQPGGLMTAPMQMGQPKQMTNFGMQMRPFMPYRYFTPTTNPFMARIT